MLVVDIRRLAREGSYPLEGGVPPDSSVWQEGDARPRGGLEAEVDVRDAGGDVLVQGTIRGEVREPCRRCLEPVSVTIEEPVTLFYRRDDDGEDGEVYPLPERAQEIDLAPGLREHWLLAAPAYVVCREACLGLCPHCGQNLNEGPCDCTEEETDSRWGPLLKLKEDK